jgi:hypothetical protein
MQDSDMADDSDDDLIDLWDARLPALESVLGKVDEMVWHAHVPFDEGGTADVVRFRHHVAGICYVTSELIGRDDQVPSTLGNYELMLCTRQESNWAADLLSRLARYTTEVDLNPGDTMDLGDATPKKSTIAAFLYLEYAKFQIQGRESGLLLCLGITADELEACQAGKRELVENELKKAGIYPFTDLYRKSVLQEHGAFPR